MLSSYFFSPLICEALLTMGCGVCWEVLQFPRVTQQQCFAVAAHVCATKAFPHLAHRSYSRAALAKFKRQASFSKFSRISTEN